MCCYGCLSSTGISLENFIAPGENFFVSKLKWLNIIKDLWDKGIHLPLSLAMEQYLLETSLNAICVPTITKNFSRHNVLGFENHYLKNSFPLQFCRAIVCAPTQIWPAWSSDTRAPWNFRHKTRLWSKNISGNTQGLQGMELRGPHYKDRFIHRVINTKFGKLSRPDSSF